MAKFKVFLNPRPEGEASFILIDASRVEDNERTSDRLRFLDSAGETIALFHGSDWTHYLRVAEEAAS